MRMNHGSILTETIHLLNKNLYELGRKVNAEEIVSIVLTHATAASISAASSSVIPGAGSLIAGGIAVGATMTMYGRLGKAMGVQLTNNLIRAVASAVVADVAAYVTCTIVTAGILSFIPVAGTIASSALTAVTNFACVYLAGLIFVKIGAALGLRNMEGMTEAEVKAQVRKACADIDMKAAMKEARAAYKTGT